MGMMSRGMWSTGCLLLMLALAAPPLRAQVVGGSGGLVGREKFAVQRCGRDRDDVVAVVTLNADGSWGAVVDGRAYAGGSMLIGKSGRKFDLSFDEGSLAQMRSVLEEFATALCGVSVTSSFEEKRKFLLKVNKKRTKAAVILKYRMQGTAGGRSGKARYSFKVKGPWVTAGGT